MGVISRQIQVKAQLHDVRARWQHFIESVLTHDRRLACDELACLSAVDNGNVAFTALGGGSATSVVFQLDVPEELPGPAHDELARHVNHDLVVFKDYVERGGMEVGEPSAVEKIAVEKSEALHGRPPRHEKLSSENDTTFWRHHFLT